MQQSNQQWLFFGAWVLATLMGVVIGIVSILTLVSGLALAGASPLLVGSIGGAALGAGLGVAQWLVLRRHTQSAGWWVVASMLGGIAGVTLGLLLSDALGPLLGVALDGAARPRASDPRLLLSRAAAAAAAGAALGLGLGAAQWLVLRQQVRSAGWWMVASGFGWMIALSIGAGLLDLVGVLGSLLFIGVLSGALTGWLLLRLLSDTEVLAKPAVGT
jgi:hypothetical protein